MERQLRKPLKKALSALLVSAIFVNSSIFIRPAKEFTAVAAASNVIYVSTEGNDFTGDGSTGNPYRSIKKAADMATAGTTVLVRPGTYIEEDIRPKESGTADAMIVFKPENDAAKGKVIIKHNDTFDGSSVTPQVKAQWLADRGWTEAETLHYTNAGIEYSIAGYSGQLTDVFNLFQRDYIWVEGFVFKDYQFARSTVNINGEGNVVINNRFEDIGTVYTAPWQWTMSGVQRPDVTVPISGTGNVVRNNYFQSVYGETLCYNGGSEHNIIEENTFIGAIGKNSGSGGSESSTLGGRFEGNYYNAFAFNYSGGSVNGGTIWLDICVRDFTALRNVAHNTAYFFFNESGCERNWAYENIVYNKPLDANGRMPASSEFFTDFPAQKIESGLFTAFWDTGSTWNARWVNNVTYNLKQGICLDRSWRDEVRNNIAYEDENSMYGANETAGIQVKETSVDGLHAWHGLDLKGGGPQIFRNNLWYSTRNQNFVKYMDPVQSPMTVSNFNAQVGGDNLGVDPMFTDAANGDFTLKSGSPAIGAGDNGVNMGAYAVYPKTEVGCNTSLGLIEDVNVSFSQLNTTARVGDVAELELRLNKPAEKTMTFEVKPIAGDAVLDKDFRFVDDPNVTFKAGETAKKVRVEILPGYDLDQLVSFRIEPTGSTRLEAVGGRDLHLMKIKRVTTAVLTVNDIGDSMGYSVVEYHEPGELVTVDAKTREGYTFDGWETGYHDIKLEMADVNSPKTTFIMPEWNPTIRAKWKLNGAPVGVTGVSLDKETLSLDAGKTAKLTATVHPDNATDKVILWTSSNPLVATVDRYGVVTAVGNGTAEIMARTLENNDTQYSAKCRVSVKGTVIGTNGVIEAEDYSVQSGIDTENCSEGGSDVAFIENGDYIGFEKVDFGSGAESLSFRVAANFGGSSIEVHLGSPDGKRIGTLEIAPTGDWQTWETQDCSIEKTSGVNDVYLVFKGGDGYLFNVNWWKVNGAGSTLLGDCNLDGKVTVADLVALQKWILGVSKTLPGAKNADLCKDGVIDVYDLGMLKKLLLSQ